MTSLTQIHKLEDRYPFNEEELEILIKCQSDLASTDHPGSFLNKLAHCSPYAFFFLPGDPIKNRVDLIEDYILPAGFGERLKDAIFSDAFPEIAHSVENQALLETFIEGVADCGRRGPREALRVLFDCVAGAGNNEAVARDAITLCYRLSVAADILVEPKVDEEALNAHLLNDSVAVDPLTRSLSAAAGNKDVVTRTEFVEWADSNVPIMSFTILTFMQNIIFHGKPIPAGKTPYKGPVLDQATNVLQKDSPLLFGLGSMTPKMGGIWHRLYSAEADGRSFNRMEWSILGYGGPTTLLVKTEEGATLGAFAAAPWHEAPKFFGSGECFVFQLDPVTNVCHSVGTESNFMYCNPSWAKGHDGLPHGLGFGGTLNNPRLFISEDFNTCKAGYLDDTYQKGDLLPKDALEQFHIKSLEIWGVGGDEVISEALQERDKYRQQTDSVVYNARVITDKTGFLPDLKSGLMDTKIYKHREETRGRAEFSYDEKHGGYSLERKEGESVPFPNEDYFNKAQ